MAKVLHTCTGCVPIDVSIIDAYVALLKMTKTGKGQDGESAYEIAVDNGFVGTEEEWLATLVGPQGPEGEQGEIGPQGIQGQQGLPGATGATPRFSIGTVTTGSPSSSADATITGTAADPVLSLTIPKGDTGATGAKGDTGATGATGRPGIDNGTFAVSVSNTTGNPTGTATVSNGELIISLSGVKGEQGNTGSSVDYPYELVNNLTTNDATKGLSAAQGVTLDQKVARVNQEVSSLLFIQSYENGSYPTTERSIGFGANNGQKLIVNVGTTGSLGYGWTLTGKKSDGTTTNLLSRYGALSDHVLSVEEDYVDLLISVANNNTGTVTISVFVQNWKEEIGLEFKRVDGQLVPAFVGDDETFSHGDIMYPVRAGGTYRVYPIIEVWPANSIAQNTNALGIGYIVPEAESPTYTIIKEKKDLGARYYDIKMPDNLPDNSMLAIGGRADKGEIVRFRIEDMTELNKVSDDLSVALENVKTGMVVGSPVSFTGNGNTYVHNYNTGLIAKTGHTYRFVPKIKAWSHTEVDNGDNNAFAIGYGTANLLYTLSATLWQFEDYYDVTYPAAADGEMIYIGGRADVGTVVEFTVFDVSEERDRKAMSLISLASQELTLSSSMTAVYLPVKIKAGRKYVVHSVLPVTYIAVQGAQTTSSALRIWTTDASSNVVDTVKQIFYRGSTFQDFFYEFVASNDAEYIGFYSRANESYSWNVNVGVYPSDFVPGDSSDSSGSEQYSGEKISLKNGKNPYKEEVISVQGIATYEGQSQQGLAIYDRYAFLTYDTGYIRVFDLGTMTTVNVYAMPEGVYGENNHAGMANFGPYFYSPSDSFPLLYVSSYLENKCYVLRVTTSSCSLVQTISMENAWHFLVDDEGNLIVHMNDWSTYLIFDLPSTSNSTVTLTASNAKDSFSFPTPGMYTTGSFCENGKMYVLCYYIDTPSGVTGRYDRMVVYDYKNKKTLSTVTFKNGAIRTQEFEGLSPTKDGEIMISFVANQLAKLTF